MDEGEDERAGNGGAPGPEASTPASGSVDEPSDYVPAPRPPDPVRPWQRGTAGSGGDEVSVPAGDAAAAADETVAAEGAGGQRARRVLDPARPWLRRLPPSDDAPSDDAPAGPRTLEPLRPWSGRRAADPTVTDPDRPAPSHADAVLQAMAGEIGPAEDAAARPQRPRVFGRGRSDDVPAGIADGEVEIADPATAPPPPPASVPPARARPRPGRQAPRPRPADRRPSPVRHPAADRPAQGPAEGERAADGVAEPAVAGSADGPSRGSRPSLRRAVRWILAEAPPRDDLPKPGDPGDVPSATATTETADARETSAPADAAVDASEPEAAPVPDAAPEPAAAATAAPRSASAPTDQPAPRRRPRPFPGRADGADRTSSRPGGTPFERHDDDADKNGDDQKPGRRRGAPKARRWVRRLITSGIVVGVLIVAAVLLRAYVVTPYSIPSASMEPTLHGCHNCNDDRVLVNTLSYHLHGVHRGDVVVFDRPSTWRAVTDDTLIKRVIGLPGDRLAIRSGKVYVNGQLLKEPYLDTKCHPLTAARGHGSHFGPVPQGKVFVMGDNRCHSEDSRALGPVPQGDIIGRAFLIIWPLGRIHYL